MTLARKGKLLRSARRPVVWRNSRAEELNCPFEKLENYLSYNINEKGITLYKKEDSDQLLLYSANTDQGESLSYQGGQPGDTFFVADGADIYIKRQGAYFTHHLAKKRIFSINKRCVLPLEWYEYYYQVTPLADLLQADPSWKTGSFQAVAFNHKGTIVGKAQNGYGEWHAILRNR